MHKLGHQLTGVGAAALAVCATHTLGGTAWLAALFAMAGTTAPDWLEIAWFDAKKRCRRCLITHRTWTHWLPLWLIALGVSIVYVQEIWGSALLGFVFGGLMHLLVDMPNPTGIPVIYPRRKRFSLKLWKSGEYEIAITACVWMFCAMIVHRTFLMP